MLQSVVFLTFVYCQSTQQSQIQSVNQDLVSRFDFKGSNGKSCSMGQSRQWQSDAGFFKQISVDTQSPCTPGFWCPANAFQPVYCCPGFYCKDPSSIAECPDGSYCPRGSIAPLPCLYLAICPKGTIKPQRFVVIIILFIIIIILSIGFSIKKKFDIQLAIKNRIQIEYVKRDRKSIVQMSTNQQTIDIEFEDLSYTLADGTPILSEVSGFLQSGKMVAVMGPSGSGKTTLFSLLTGKLKRTTGSFLLNGMKEELSQYRGLMGYVPQDDIMIKELTVDNILTHSALMRLPSNMKYVEKRKKVLEVIKYLGLKTVLNSKIGTNEVRGISGGQRKRVNIGMELVCDPSILFLDEPTSGLDSSTALELSLLLKKLAQEKRITIAAIVHAPNPQVFYQFDDVLFLGKDGKVVYFGPTMAVEHYFKELGFQMNLENPADFAIDVISGKIPCELDPDFKPSDLSVFWDQYQRGISVSELRQDQTLKRHRSTRQRRVQKSVLANLSDSLKQMLSDTKEWLVDVASDFNFMQQKSLVRKTPNMFKLYLLLLKRAGMQLFRTPKLLLFDLLIHSVAGIIVSIADQDFQYLGKLPKHVCDFTVTGSPTYDMCSNPVDWMSNAGMIMIFGILFSGQAAAVPTFSHEKTVYWRDRSSGMPALPYYLAKITVDIPRIFLAAVFYTLAFLVFFDYRSPFYWLFFLVIATYFTAFHMGYFLSIILPRDSVLLFCAASSLLFGFLFSGVTPDYANVVSDFSGVRWIWDLSAPRYAVELFYILEVGARPWQELKDEPWLHNYSRDNFGSSIVGLIGVGVMWGCLSFLALKLAKRQKQK